MKDAAQALRKGRIRLMLDYPFMASSIAAFNIAIVHDRNWCPTMATNGFEIFANPTWIEEQDEATIEFVIAHEVLHCLLGHIDRRENRDHWLWNIAIDYATNSMLVDAGLPMPAQGLFDPTLRGLPAEAIYDLFHRKSKRHPSGFRLLDTHLDPGQAESMGASSIEMPSLEERRRFRKVLHQDFKKALPGTMTGLWTAEISASVSREVPWRELLARFISGLRRGDYRMYPFNKKHIWRGMYLPSVGVPSPDHIVVAIDTSGSMTVEQINQVMGEVDSLRSVTGCRLTLIESDTDIQRVTVFEAEEEAEYVGLTEVLGRGGTDFRPVFKWVQNEIEQGRPMDAVVYLTDGFGNVPERVPAVPVLWIVPWGGRLIFPWGSVIQLSRTSEVEGLDCHE